MSEFIHKKHNVSVLLYHIVCPAKYRRAVFTPEVDEKLKEICEEISLRYEIEFLEIGADSDHVHFLVQNLPPHKYCFTSGQALKTSRAVMLLIICTSCFGL